ncbi:uncharacterized protein METZ01_LOCUS247060, partial [marine metagenome]
MKHILTLFLYLFFSFISLFGKDFKSASTV